ncbi:MAG: efflux RND transporter permease subunit [Proteobacteria bacterium]|nr:efflux RND transporter permease subunit [Pseudomonadota bacterium]MCZ6783803.1 efflux RND transporter permease subunit [Pseudomonadota bacterium]
MTLSDVSIERPVLTLMMILSIIVFGVLGYQRLGVDQYPNMEFPVVTVGATLEGASPEVMEEDVTDVLEEQINTIAGLRNLSSTTIHGITRIYAEFGLDTDIDVAAQDVRDRISMARRDLPANLDPPVVSKLNMSNFPIVWVPLMTERTMVESSEYVRYHVKPELETIPGVGAVQMFGRLDRNIRVWLDGEALRARGLSATDILAALRREHVEIPGGRVESVNVEYVVKTDAEFETLEELERLVVAYVDGAAVRLGDVARVEDGAADVRVLAHYNGGPSVGAGVLKQPGENTVAIVDEVYARIERLNASAPSGIQFGRHTGLIDFSLSIREAVAETQFALVLGAILATLTVFVFLRRWRPTLIVASAIPLSLIGTFGVMWIFGFTLNVMTLLGLTLAVGVVIDDAIVVLENIERRREEGEAPYEAARNGTRQIAFAATAATVSIAVVFLPVVFVTGIVGNFLREFGGTVAAAVMISLFVALTLTPMLAARMPPPAVRAHGSMFHRLEQGFAWLERRYRELLAWALDHRASTLGIAGLSLLMSCGISTQLGTEFMPPADEGRMMVRFELPPGSSLAASEEYLGVLEEWVLAQPEVTGLFAGIGFSGREGPGGSNQGMLFTILKPRDERERSAQDLIAATREYLATLPGDYARVFDMSFSAGGGDGDFEFDLKGNLPLVELDALADRFLRELDQRGGYYDLEKSLKLGLPEVRVIPDREKAAALGIDATNLATVIQTMIGGIDVATFKDGGHGIDIRVRLEEKDRSEPESIGRLYARANDGSLVELRNLVRVETGAAPSAITRTNRQRSVSLYGNLQGKRLGEAVADAREIAARILPEGVVFELSGEADAMRESVSQFGLMIALSILVIYMVLAAQFESLIHPLTVMLSLPLAMVGALGGLWAAGMTLNLFSMIGILLLLGLVTKNSILLVDYANQLRAQGMEKVEAMRTAAPVRMRPVLMTAISMIFGVLPAATGWGPGSETRQPLGVATAAGMLSSTALTLLIVPVFYVVLDDGVEKLKSLVRRALGRPAPSSGSVPVRPT